MCSTGRTAKFTHYAGTTIFTNSFITFILSWIGRLMAAFGIGGSMAVIAEGSRAPSFTLVNQDGVGVESKSFAGKYVLLWWYPKADTPG